MQKRNLLIIEVSILGFFLTVFGVLLFKSVLEPEKLVGENIGKLAGDKDLNLEPKPALSFNQGELLKNLKNAVEIAKSREDYLPFAEYLKTVYKNGLDKNKQFMEVESDLYVFTDKEYFVQGHYNKSLEFSTVVYNQVFQSWRFLYLRVLSLEALGREAFRKNDLQAAEQYAMTILQMTYRLEGANLLTDIYIQKIRDKMKSGDVESAQRDLVYIIDFQVSDDRKTILIALWEELSSLAQNKK